MALGIDYGVSVNEMQLNLNNVAFQNYLNKLDRETDEFIKANIDQELKNEFLEIAKYLSQYTTNLMVEQVAAIGIEMYKQMYNLRSFKIDRYESIEKMLDYELRQFKTERKDKHGKIRYYAYPILLSSICEAEYKK